MIEAIDAYRNEIRLAARSLWRAKGLTLAVVLTLALGIGANAAMFTLVRGVLLRPLVNRDEARLIYIRQTANGDNASFSVPEMDDLRARVRTFSSFGDFSTLGFTMTGLGEPRSVQAGVVGGSYFNVMGLRPVLGRLLDARDDGPQAAGAVVLTYRFWSTALNSDPAVVGKTVRLGSFIDVRPATVVGVLEPCVPYPQETEIIANIVTSAHHLSATMVTGRIHRMTELFARLAPGVDLAAARADLESAYAVMKRERPDAYRESDFRVSAKPLREQLTSGARDILLGLLAASVLVFVIACSNVANLILARSLRRETELGIRAALGANAIDLRRSLLAESLLLCGAGAAIGVLIARPLTFVLARYASRFTVRALDLTVDSGMLWVAAGLALLAATLLAFVPRLPSTGGPQGFALVNRSSRITGAANRKLRVFALVQIAASFVLVTAAGATIKTLLSLEFIQTGFDTRHVLAVNVPVIRDGRAPDKIVGAYREAARQIHDLPGVLNVAIGSTGPWRDDPGDRPFIEFAMDGHVPASDEDRPRAQFEVVSPAYFTTLGLPVLEGRDFNDADRRSAEPVAIVSESVAKRMFPGASAVNHHVLWTDPLLEFAPFKAVSRRIIGVVPDVDNTNLAPKATSSIYHVLDQEPTVGGGRLLVHVRSDPYALVTPITKIIRGISPDQPVEDAATLEDVRSQVLSPERLNVMVSGVFAGVALLIAVVGVAGVLAFSVSGRMREFGIRLAVGSQPRDLLLRVIAEGAAMAAGGLAVGFASGYWLAQLAGNLLGNLKIPGVLPVAGSAVVLLCAAVIASAIPAARASRIDVIQALRTE